MAKKVRHVMTPDPVSMSSDTPIVQAARAMSDHHIGSVVVMQNDKPLGIVKDRDITVRAIAKGSDPSKTRLVEVCSTDIAAVRADQSVDDAIKIVKSHDVKRVLVMENSKLAGIVSLGDLTVEGEGKDVQPDLSHALSNN